MMKRRRKYLNVVEKKFKKNILFCFTGNLEQIYVENELLYEIMEEMM